MPTGGAFSLLLATLSQTDAEALGHPLPADCVSLEGTAEAFFERDRDKPAFTAKDNNKIKLLSFKLELEEDSRRLFLRVDPPKQDKEFSKQLLRHLKIKIKANQDTKSLIVDLDTPQRLDITFRTDGGTAKEVAVFQVQDGRDPNSELGDLYRAISAASGGKKPRVNIDANDNTKTFSLDEVRRDVGETQTDNHSFFLFPGDRLVKVKFDPGKGRFEVRQYYVPRPLKVEAFQEKHRYLVRSITLLNEAKAERQQLSKQQDAKINVTAMEKESVKELDSLIARLSQQAPLEIGPFPARLSLKLEDGDEFVFSDSLTPNQ